MEEAEVGGVGERFTRVGVLGVDEMSLHESMEPLAILRSRGLFSEVGVSQLLESERLLCCFRRNFSRLLATIPSAGDLRPISESMGRSEGGSRGVKSAKARDVL